MVNATGVSGLARQAARALEVQGFTGVTTGTAATTTEPVVVEYSGQHAEDARTVAAAFPGAVVEKTSGLGATVRVTLGRGAPEVVEVPNRLGSAPLPSPSISSQPEPHRVDPDPGRRHRHLLLSRGAPACRPRVGSGVVAALSPGQHGQDHADVRPELGHVRREERPRGTRR